MQQAKNSNSRCRCRLFSWYSDSGIDDLAQIHFNLSVVHLILIPNFILFVSFAMCSCRATNQLPELPLSAHLLAPIQRICRYPLHLSELVKHSPSKQELKRQHGDEDDSSNDHSIDSDTLDSKETFELALAAMKRVTEMVNEGNIKLLPFWQPLFVIHSHFYLELTAFLFHYLWKKRTCRETPQWIFVTDSSTFWQFHWSSDQPS